jgi:hypothetical protein
MTLAKRIFSARISGKPINIDHFKLLRTRFINELLKYNVLAVCTAQPLNLSEDEIVFKLNDSVSSNGAEYAIGQRILFSELNINGIVQVAEDS